MKGIILAGGTGSRLRPLRMNNRLLDLRDRFIGHLKMPLYVNAYYLMANTVVGSILGFAFWTVAARYYSPQDIGLSSALISSTGLIMTISNLGLGAGLIRFLPSSSKPNSLINSSLILTSLASFIVGVIFLSGLNLWSPKLIFILKDYRYILFFLALSIFTMISSIQDNIFIAYRSAKFTFMKNTIIAIIKIILLLFLLNLGAFGIFSATGIGIILAVLISMTLLLPKVIPDYRFSYALDKDVLKDTIRFSFENYVAGLVGGLHTMILPLMILNTLGAEANAYYYIAYSIAGVLFIIPGAISTSLFAEGSNDITNLSHNVKRSLQLSLMLLSLGIITVFLFGDKILLLFGKTYSQASFEMLKLLSISAIPIAINSIIFTVLRINFKMKTVIRLSALNSIGILALAYLLSQKFQLTGIGIAWIIMQSVVFICAIISVRKLGRI